MADIQAVTGIVLAGGRGRRAGGPKADLPFAGSTLLAWTVARLAACLPDVVVAVRDPDAAIPAGARRAVDVAGADGPLAGLVAALEAAPTRWAFVVGCDMPLVDAATVRALIARAGADPDALAVVPLDGLGRLQPLHACWRTDAAPVLRRLLHSGERALHRALGGLRTDRVPASALAHCPGALRSFADADTASDLALLEAEALGAAATPIAGGVA